MKNKTIKTLVIFFLSTILFNTAGAEESSKSAPMSSMNDQVTLVNGPLAVDSGDTISVSVSYEASETRDISCVFQLNAPSWPVYASSESISVNAGVGTVNCTMTIPNDTPAGDNYHYQVIITPTGGGWNNRLHNLSQSPVTLTSVGTEDRIISVSGPSPVIQGGTITIPVAYEATQVRDLKCIFQLSESPSTVYATVTKIINPGFATEDCTFTIPADTPVGTNYHYHIIMMPTGGNWDNQLDNMYQTSIEITSTLLNEDIRLNQQGYFQTGKKIISVKTDSDGVFHIKSPDLATTYFSGQFSAPAYWDWSKENIATIDFTSFDTVGEFVVDIPGIGQSHIFEVNNQVALEPLRKSLKAYYFMRSSSPVTAEHGGQWARGAGHPDTSVVIHQSAATASRPEGTIISSPKGWYDAGDYNKYIINSGITTYTLLAAYEQFPELFNSLNTNIPESSNNIPDILDEIKWNLDWMLTMQDPNDGGVYFKLTNANFDGVVMPEDGQSTPRYVIQKVTASALNFAAVMATAARVFNEFDPVYAAQCLEAAKAAWAWANSNPNIFYNQNEHNELYDPDIVTGGYTDNNIDSEFIWAAAELYIATQDDNYYTTIDWPSISTSFVIPNWPDVAFLPVYSLLLHQNDLTTVGSNDIPLLRSKLIDKANDIKSYYEESAHRVPSGYNWRSFVWGGNAIAANMGIILVKAFSITGDTTYLNAASGSFDYILGRNATNYSFVTALGDKSSQNPHHRPSQADNVTEPVPGMLVGGPTNFTNPDGCSYPAQEPANKYLDSYCSYSTNEITINWNAAFVFLSAALHNNFRSANNDLIFRNSFE